MPKSSYPSDTHFFALDANEKWALTAITEIDSQNCKLISTGTYVTTGGLKYGKLTTAIIELKDPSGPCAGKEFSYNFAYYTWTSKEAPEPQDFFHLQWITPDHTINDSDWLPELLPEAETERFCCWDGSIPAGLWWPILQPTTIHYAGVTVKETDPTTQTETCHASGNPTKWSCIPDTCFFPGSKAAAQINDTLEGGPVKVGQGNIWKGDLVGMNSAIVKYYRSIPRTPCGFTWLQQMKIQFATGDPNWYDYGKVNILGGWFNATIVESVRAGEQETEVWP